MTTVDLNDTAHRNIPMPAGRPWVQAQMWDDLLFAHWPIPVKVMRQAVPKSLDLDLWEGKAWLGVVPFDLSYLRFRFVPQLPGISGFAELNVRTYVTVNGVPGVYFFSLDAANLLAVIGARIGFHLPYFHARMSIQRDQDWYVYSSQRIRGEANYAARYRPIGPPSAPVRGTHEYFLAERYCLYAVDGRGTAYRGDIHHAPWQLQPAELNETTNTMGRAAGFQLEGQPLLHFSKHQHILAWGLVRA